MTQRINDKHTYPQGVEDLFKIYTTTEWIPKRYEGIGMRNVSVQKCEQQGETWNVWTSREVKAQLPRALSKFAQDWNTLTQKETWTRKGESYECDISVDISGLPVGVLGHMVVQTHQGGSANIIELNVRCDIPLLGRKVEKFVAGDTAKSIKQEYAWIQDFLNTNS